MLTKYSGFTCKPHCSSHSLGGGEAKHMAGEAHGTQSGGMMSSGLGVIYHDARLASDFLAGASFKQAY